jgi:hypothetical protein
MRDASFAASSRSGSVAGAGDLDLEQGFEAVVFPIEPDHRVGTRDRGAARGSRGLT